MLDEMQREYDDRPHPPERVRKLVGVKEEAGVSERGMAGHPIDDWPAQRGTHPGKTRQVPDGSTQESSCDNVRGVVNAQVDPWQADENQNMDERDQANPPGNQEETRDEREKEDGMVAGE